MKQRLFVLNCVAAALVGLAPLAPAAAAEGYLTAGQDPDVPVRSAFGECVHTYAWHEGLRYADCEPAPAPAPAPVALPEPAPQPVVEAPKAEPVPQNVPFRLSTDTFFDFDKSTLRVEGRAALDDVANRLAVTNYDTITIVGHADRIGTRKYNQALSERRAQAMRDYLFSKGVAREKISAGGVGSSEPTAQCSHVRGAKLIACLQPDRFAEVTVSGTTTTAAN
jgi:OOP family OmpA-OmpF porin